MSVNRYDMAYIEKGTGTPVIFVHGAAVDYRYLAEQVDHFATKYRAIAVSLRHYYPERWDGEGEFSLRQQVDDLVAFMKGLNAGPVHLVGHSRGGTAALYAAKAAPGLVRTVTFAEGGVGMPEFAPPGEGGTETRKTAYRGITERFNRGDIDGGLEIFATFVNGPGTWEKYPDNVRQSLRDNAWTLVGADKDQWDPFTCDDARSIDLPFLLLGAEKSPAMFAKILDKVQPCLRRAERGLIRDSNHSMPLRNPAAFNAAIMEFIAKY